MSDANILIGYIEEPLPTYRDDREFFRRANDVVLATLPTDDPFPPLCRSLFATTGEDHAHGAFRGLRLIHFAGHFNHFGASMNDWLDKFESLLRRLYWLQAEVLLLQTWSAHPMSVQYTASADAIQGYTSADPRLPQGWEVRGFAVNYVEARAGDTFAWSILSRRVAQ